MPYYFVFWNYEPGGNVEHIADNDLTQDDVESVLFDPDERGVSRSSGEEVVFGEIADGRYIMVVFERISSMELNPITAYEVDR
ncbi:hypothetical protein [Alienimonas californiensis]|uniref:Uncharacterized protein n=1 Tax=Alienimonas californiensis TaxID=2527989 RepID=A0A517P832_9PLAN|nr:hypothetical protein [Alienimonas californiensis]QDT15522.1 hypothetical protein CA12_16070 [Alienimonas californiensis]